MVYRHSFSTFLILSTPSRYINSHLLPRFVGRVPGGARSNSRSLALWWRALRRPGGVIQEFDAGVGKADAPGFVECAQGLFESLLAGAKCLANHLGRAVIIQAQPASATLEG